MFNNYLPNANWPLLKLHNMVLVLVVSSLIKGFNTYDSHQLKKSMGTVVLDNFKIKNIIFHVVIIPIINSIEKSKLLKAFFPFLLLASIIGFSCGVTKSNCD